MKSISIVLLYILIVAGAAGVAFGLVGSIIYFIYELCVNDIGLKLALWEACKVWMILVIGGSLLASISYFFYSIIK